MQIEVKCLARIIAYTNVTSSITFPPLIRGSTIIQDSVPTAPFLPLFLLFSARITPADCPECQVLFPFLLVLILLFLSFQVSYCPSELLLSQAFTPSLVVELVWSSREKELVNQRPVVSVVDSLPSFFLSSVSICFCTVTLVLALCYILQAVLKLPFPPEAP